MVYQNVVSGLSFQIYYPQVLCATTVIATTQYSYEVVELTYFITNHQLVGTVQTDYKNQTPYGLSVQYKVRFINPFVIITPIIINTDDPNIVYTALTQITFAGVNY